MTARDDAINVATDNTGENMYVVTDIIDAIPGDVLVRLAIERGALQHVEVDSELRGRQPILWDGKTLIDPNTKLYRAMTP